MSSANKSGNGGRSGSSYGATTHSKSVVGGFGQFCHTKELVRATPISPLVHRPINSIMEQKLSIEEGYPMADIEEPHLENDILYGRGGGTNIRKFYYPWLSITIIFSKSALFCFLKCKHLTLAES
jgi:hypothetical protein